MEHTMQPHADSHTHGGAARRAPALVRRVLTAPLGTGFSVPREGRLWLLVAIGLFFIGWGKGINLVVLLSYLMLLLWGMNALVAGRRLHRLQAHRRIDGLVFAGTPVNVAVEVVNLGRRSEIGFRVDDHGLEHDMSWFQVRLRAGQGTRLTHELTVPRRGRYVCDSVSATSGFPFGLACRTVAITAEEEVLVLPRLGRVHRGRLRRFLTWTAPLEEHLRGTARLHRTAQSEFHGLRPMRSGDSPRWIHWRTSARRGELMVREFEKAASDNLVLVVEPWLPAPLPCLLLRKKGAPAEVELPRPVQALEDALSLAASICQEWCRQRGDQFALAVAGRAPIVLKGLTGPEHARQMLECLALVEGEPSIEPASLLDRLAVQQLPAGPVLLVSTRPSPLGDALAAHLHRPVAALDADALDGQDFYERPVGDAT
jgi:uncharacterized protein (DUF58 family)